jgi:chemotaxis family two-component system response regulator Rcp1
MTTSSHIKVLLVDDNEADVDLTHETLKDGKLKMSIEVARDGVEALEVLQKLQASGDVPDLILLDLNMPRLDGRGFLAEMRKHDAFRIIPVVVLTSSDAERDVVKSYELGANCYVNKPIGLEAFQTIVRAVESFWLTVVKLPS